jgi:hypothetical protein
VKRYFEVTIVFETDAASIDPDDFSLENGCKELKSILEDEIAFAGTVEKIVECSAVELKNKGAVKTS